MTTTNTIPQVNATVKLNADVADAYLLIGFNLISLEPFAGKTLKVIEHHKGEAQPANICSPFMLLVEDEEGNTIFVEPEDVTEVSGIEEFA